MGIFQYFKKSNRNQESHTQVLHIECRKLSRTLIQDQLSQWVSSGEVSQLFGDYIKVVEFINPKNIMEHASRIIIMNSHARRFKDSIGMVKLQGVHKPNRKISLVPVNYSVRALIIC